MKKWLLGTVLALAGCGEPVLAPTTVLLPLVEEGEVWALSSPCQEAFKAIPVSFEREGAFPSEVVVRFKRGNARDGDFVHLVAWEGVGAAGVKQDEEVRVFGSKGELFLSVEVPCGRTIQVDAGCGGVPGRADQYGGNTFNKAWVREGPSCRDDGGEVPPTGNPPSPNPTPSATPSPSASPTPKPTPKPRPWPRPTPRC